MPQTSAITGCGNVIIVCIKFEHSSNKVLKNSLLFLFCLNSTRSCPAEKPGPSDEIIITLTLSCDEICFKAFVKDMISSKDSGLCFCPLVNSTRTMWFVSLTIVKRLCIYFSHININLIIHKKHFLNCGQSIILLDCFSKILIENIINMKIIRINAKI